MLIIYCCVTNYPQILQLKLVNYCLTVSVDQESRLSQLPVAQNLSQGCSEHVGQDCSHPKALLGRDSLPSSLSRLLAQVPAFCPRLLSHLGLSMGQLTTQAGLPQSERARELRECIAKVEVMIVYNPILAVTFHHFCPILLERSHQVQSTLKERGIYKGMNSRKSGSLGP